MDVFDFPEDNDNFRWGSRSKSKKDGLKSVDLTIKKKKSINSIIPSSSPKRMIKTIIEPAKTQSRYTRSVSEVGTPLSFLPFHRRKPSDSIWDVVDAVTSPVDLSTSPRKQNLVAKMTKPPVSKSDKSNTLSHLMTYRDPTFSSSKSMIDTSPSTSYNTRDDMFIEDIIATSSNALDFPSSPPQSYNANISGSPGVQKTYGKGRTIIRQDDLDSLLSDTFMPSSLFQSDDVEKDLIIKKNEVKSSHELREVGGNARFIDEINYILDGLRENHQLSVRRNSGMELSRKLLNGEFLLKVRAHNYIPKIYVMLNKNQDSFIRCCFAFIICLLIEDKHSSELLIREHGFMELIVNTLNNPLDPFDDSNESLKRSERLLIKEMKEIIIRSAIFEAKSQISLKSIALRTLSSLTSLKTRYEGMIKTRLRVSGGLSSVINILKTELEPVTSLLSRIENGKALNLSENILDFECIGQCLKIIENATLFCAENQFDIVEKDKELLRMLLEFLLYCQVEACSKNIQRASVAMECLLGSLRVLINLSNDNQPCCQCIGCIPGMPILVRLATLGQLPHNDSVATNIGSDKMDLDSPTNSTAIEAVKFDVLLLSIGLLINLVEMDPGSQDEFRKVEQNPFCTGSRTCLRTCTCPSRESAVSCFVSLYNYQLEKEDDETDSNIIAAYLAVLLGLLIKNNHANQLLIIDRLPDRSVNSLINLLQQFVHFNELVGEEASASGHLSGQLLMSSSSLDQVQLDNIAPHPQGKTIGDSFLDIVDMLKSLET
ncbi:wings apart-like protein regulation of heterochromatin-domain-containing protein [Gigaspora rosea]|uniref:Wings apart-like protein regulation of heterochromatin-domain-containing protein n=1 Tax=Gigaspora rosea TaxID=44941 RepID=A0A397VRA0_9GLOM|nr:wings apart-like protein regulation of heterochromatin-domain-containing protein [Gigaspora rosea]